MKALLACLVTAAVTAGVAIGSTGITNIYQGGVANFVGKKSSARARIGEWRASSITRPMRRSTALASRERASRSQSTSAAVPRNACCGVGAEC